MFFVRGNAKRPKKALNSRHTYLKTGPANRDRANAHACRPPPRAATPMTPCPYRRADSETCEKPNWRLTRHETYFANQNAQTRPSLFRQSVAVASPGPGPPTAHPHPATSDAGPTNDMQARDATRATCPALQPNQMSFLLSALPCAALPCLSFPFLSTDPIRPVAHCFLCKW